MITKIDSGVTFSGKIIDSHVHCGKWTNDLFSTNDVLEFFNRKFNNGKDTVDKVIINNKMLMKIISKI